MQFQQPQRKKDSKKHLQTISLEVEQDWQYWRPIACGLVKIDKADYDREGPLFAMKLNAAMDIRARREKEAIEREKAGQQADEQ